MGLPEGYTLETDTHEELGLTLEGIKAPEGYELETGVSAEKHSRSIGEIGKAAFDTAADTALGAVEGPAGVVTGIAGFLGGLVPATGEVIKGVVGGDIKEGLIAGGEKLEQVMEAATFQPKSQFGQTIMGVASAPFAIAHEELMKSQKDRAWVNSLSEEQRALLSEGRIKDPKAMKEAWAIENPNAGEREGKASQAAFDLALGILLPMVKKTYGGKDIPVELRPEAVKRIAEGVVKQEPGIDINAAMKAADVAMKEFETPVREATAVVGTNQNIVNQLRDISDTKSGYSKGNYTRIANTIDRLDVDLSLKDLSEIEGMKSKKGKIRGVVEKMLEERESKPVEETITDVKLVDDIPDFAEPERVKAAEKQLVEESGATPEDLKYLEDLKEANPRRWQELLEEGGEFVIPNVSKETAKAVDTAVKEAEAPPKFENKKAVELEGYSLADSRRFTKTESANKAAIEKSASTGQPMEVVQIGNKYAVAKSESVPLKKYSTLEAANAELEVLSEIPEAVAKRRLEVVADEPGSHIVEVDGKFYNAVDRVEMGEGKGAPVPPTDLELRTVSEDYVEGLKEVVEDEIRVPSREEFVAQYQAVKDKQVSSVRKLNEVKEPTSRPVTPEQLPAVVDEFKIFDDFQSADAYKKAAGIEGTIIVDPVTKKAYIERNLPESRDRVHEYGDPIDEYATDGKEYLGNEEFGVDYGESSETMVRDLIDIFNNERGSIPIGTDLHTLRNLTNKLTDIQRAAKRAGMTVEKFLDKLNLTDEMRLFYLDSFERIPEFIERFKEEDHINERILNPEGKVVHLRPGPKGTANVPITETIVRESEGAPRNNNWKVTRSPKENIILRKARNTVQHINDFQKLTETKLNAFERYGKFFEDMWHDWTEKATDSAREHKGLVQKLRKIRKKLTKKEWKDMAIASTAAQHGGIEKLAAYGIVDIPVMTPKMREVFNELVIIKDNIFDRINYTRVRTGQTPIPVTNNHFPFMYNMNTLRKFGVLDGLTTMPIKRLNSINNQFKGTLNPYGKKRSVNKIPVELDLITALDNYAKQGLKEIHVSPIAALAKEIATQGFDITGGVKNAKGKLTKQKKYMREYNPELAQILDVWGDEIIGIDSVKHAVNTNWPGARRFIDNTSTNIVTATIVATVSPALKQPSAVWGTMTTAGFYNMGYGVARMGGSKVRRVFKGESTAGKLSNILEIRRADIMIERLYDMIALSKGERFKKGAGLAGALPMNVLDALTAEASWYAQYRFAQKSMKLKGGTRGGGAAKYADKMTAKTNAVGIRGQASPIQSFPGLGRVLSILQTFAISDFNNLTRDVLGVKNPNLNKKTQFKRSVRAVVAGAMINEAYKAIGMDAPHPAPIDAYIEATDEGSSRSYAAAMAALEMVEKVPLVGGAIKYRSSLFGIAGGLAEDVPEAVFRAIKMLNWENMSEKELAYNIGFVVDVGLTVKGIPGTAQMKKSMRAAAQGGTTWEIILGAYIDADQKRRSGSKGSSKVRSN